MSIGQGRRRLIPITASIAGFFQLLIGKKEKERERGNEKEKIIFVEESDSWKLKNRGHARYAESRPAINSNSAVKEGTRKADVDNCA